MIKKLTSILLVVMLLATLTPGVIFAADTTVETKVYSERAHVKGGAPNSVLKVEWNGINIRNTGINDVNDWYAFYKFDLSGLEDKIEKATKATLTLKSSNASTAFTVALLNDTCDNWSASTLTYNKANELGMLSNSSNSTNVQSGITLTANTEYTTTNFADALRAAIADNPTNSIVTFRFYGDTSTLITFKGSDNVKLNLEYNEKDLSTDALFEAKKDTLAWDDITTQSIDNVTNDLKLPTKFYGFDLSWKSDNVAISSDGTVTQPRGDNVNVTLTATLNYNGATASKAFTVTVPAAQASVETKVYSDRAHVKAKNNTVQLIKGGNPSYNIMNLRKTGINNDNDWYGFFKFDLSGLEDKIEKATKATLSIKSEYACSAFTISILSDKCDAWSSSSLIYNEANNLGMLSNSSNSTNVQSGITLTANTEYTTANFADALRAAIADNPTNSIVTFRFYADSSTLIQFKGVNNVKLNLEYYDEDVAADSFFEEKKDTLLWNNITTQSINNVVADLDLPSQFYGFDVTWSSSNDAAINSAGEVTVSGTKTPVTLTATITDGTNIHTKEFTVTVSDKKYAIEFSNEIGTAAKIYAAENKDAVLVFAAYAEKTLLSVAPVDITLTEGENLVNSLLDTTGATEIKIMLLSNMDNLTPLCTYKAK